MINSYAPFAPEPPSGSSVTGAAGPTSVLNRKVEFLSIHWLRSRWLKLAAGAVLVIGMAVDSTQASAAPGSSRAPSSDVPSTVVPAVVQNAVFSWGEENGGLGTGVSGDSPTPTAVIPYSGLAGKHVTAISTNSSQTCAIASSQLVCWGANPLPLAVGGAVRGLTPTAISVGEDHYCAIFSGKAFCWGLNTYGELGSAPPADSSDYAAEPVPVRTDGVLAGKTVQVISAGRDTTCALADGKPYCWGFGFEGQLGNGGAYDTAHGSYPNSAVPVAVDTSGVLAGKTITDIATGGTGSCALASGQVYCWGDAIMVGSDSYDHGSSVPVAVDTSGVLHGKTVTDLSVGADTVCVVAAGKPYCWGANGSGGLGGGPSGSDSESESHPVAVFATGALAGRTVTEVGVGAGHSCVLASGSVYCWGDNSFGEMGLGTTGGKGFPPEPVYTGGALAGRSITLLAVGNRQTFVTTAQPPAPVVTPGSFVPLTASRVMDTRPGGIPARSSIGVQVLGRGGVPTSGVSAVVANLTAVASRFGGYLSVARDGDPQPRTSTLDFPPKAIVANLSVIPVGADGKIRIFNGSAGITPVLVDVTGYYVGGTATTPGSYVNVSPIRLLDTRPGGMVGTSSAQLTHVQMANIPQSVTVNANVTALSNETAGSLQLTYADQLGLSSVLSFGAHDAVANMVNVTFNEGSGLSLVTQLNSSRSESRTNAILDVNGYFTAGEPYAPGTFTALRPTDVLKPPAGVIAASADVPIQVTGQAGVPTRAVAAVAVHLTVTGSAAPGFLSLTANGAPGPTTSVLNFAARQTVSNTAIVPVGADGKLRLYNFSKGPLTTQVTVTGYYRTGGL